MQSIMITNRVPDRLETSEPLINATGPLHPIRSCERVLVSVNGNGSDAFAKPVHELESAALLASSIDRSDMVFKTSITRK